MTTRPVPDLTVESGPWLLRSPRPDLVTHRAIHGNLPQLDLAALLAAVGSARVRGRGGAGFPFATKLEAAARRGRRHVVVNLSEGEPASRKDLALALTQPHLVLDGASLSAQALGVRTVEVVLPGDHPAARRAVEGALAERQGLDRSDGVRWELHDAPARFVAGEASAVTELLAGRPGLPVTSWEPTAVSGVRGRPTLLSNAETYAHVAAVVLHGSEAYAAHGTAEEPGTTLLTISPPVGVGDGARGGARVVEVDHGTPWAAVLDPAQLAGPMLLGGFHGTWAGAGDLVDERVTRHGLTARGLTLGAGIVLPLAAGACPLERTAEILDYLAAESAGRCGPCFNGLPALARAFSARVLGLPRDDAAGEVERLAALVEGRGACAHPDGSVRMVRSALRAFPDELAAHDARRCSTGSLRGEVLR